VPIATAQPNTHAIGTQIVSYLAGLQYLGNPNFTDGTKVYTLAQLEAIKDVIPLIANGGACVEVYGDKDVSERRGFGGRVWDTQTWYLLSMCSLDTAAYAATIYDVRDALVQPFQAHAQLGNVVSNLFHSALEADGKFWRVMRTGQWVRAHLITLQTRQEWYVPTPPGVTS
jgi:hypothetical protein